MTQRQSQGCATGLPAGRGYHRLADLMQWAPSMAIFARFRGLNMLHLLLLQAELTELEEDLQAFVGLELKSLEPDRMAALYDWTSLRKLDDDNPTKRTLEIIRGKLDAYSEPAS